MKNNNIFSNIFFFPDCKRYQNPSVYCNLHYIYNNIFSPYFSLDFKQYPTIFLYITIFYRYIILYLIHKFFLSRLQTISNYFICSLCFSDLFSALICSPLWLYRRTWGFNEWMWGDFLCKLLSNTK